MSITKFQGPHRFLSNFWPAVVMLDGYHYPSVEHAYQAAKFRPEDREPFRNPELRAGDAKRKGRGKAPRNWHQISLDTMADLVWQKFEEPKLRQQLLSTGEQELVEGNNWHDVFYGVCDGTCRQRHAPYGDNHLGIILMNVRYMIQNNLYPTSI